MPQPPGGKAGLTIRAQTGPMAWLLLLLVPIFGLPVLRMVLLPVRRGPSVPWPAIGIGLALAHRVGIRDGLFAASPTWTP